MKKKKLSLQDKAELALQEAVKRVVNEHKKTGRPLAIWKNGRTVLVSPDSI
jgi:hypothetical protein